ncbi:MAG: hypothetical protein K2X81_04470, partial [Candidatus Obscuribacterales bacterium]|nr:hypothetical protein [Candidatus Obscuribacterales bacterium]
MRLRDQITNCLYQSPGYIDEIRRLTGLWLICCMPLQCMVLFRVGICGPYHVPAWRIGNTFLSLPDPPLWFSSALLLLEFFLYIALIAGVRKKFIPAVLLIIFAYYQFIDIFFHCGFVILLAFYLIAFLIDRFPFSLSRRVIQISVSSCYLFAAVGKVHPEYFDGFTLYHMLGKGFVIRPQIRDLILSLHISHDMATFLSIFVIVLEVFLGLGLWFKSTRLFTAIVGVLFHCALTLSLPGIEPFAPVMCTAYLAFFEKRGDSTCRNLSFKKPVSDMLLLFFVCFASIAMPTRFYMMPREQLLSLSYFDRAPLGLAMYLFNEEVKSVQVSYQTSDAQWHQIDVQGRMAVCSSTSDMLSLAYYLQKMHPEADTIKIITRLQVNGHKMVLRQLSYVPAQSSFKFSS